MLILPQLLSEIMKTDRVTQTQDEAAAAVAVSTLSAIA